MKVTHFPDVFRTIRLLTAAVAVMLMSALAQAGSNQRMTYSGRIIKPDQTPARGTVSFQLSIYSPNNCLLWSESQSLDLTNDSGTFSLELGDTANRTTGLSSFDKVFQNYASVSGLTGQAPCTGTYSPSPDHDRTLVVTFNDGTGNNTLTLPIKSVPYAQQAENANKLFGYPLSGSASNGQALIFDSGSSSWVPTTLSGGGSLSSVGIQFNAPLDAVLSLSNSPLTGAGGTISFALQNQNPNTVFAGPSSGAATTPSFRALVANDLPTIPTNKGGTGLTTTGTSNQILGMNNAASGTEYKSITGGSGITVTHSAGGIEIAATNSGTVTSVGATAPLNSSGGATPSISISSGTATGQTLRWDGSAWTKSALGISDITNLSTQLSNKLDQSQMPANCAANQTLTFSSPTGTWACSNIGSLAASTIASGTLDVARLGSGTADNTKYLRGDGSWQTLPSGADNLGNHTATQNLNLATYQLVGNGGTSGVSIDNGSAALDVSSTSKGFLPPRMTTAQKNAIASPANGLVVFDTDLNSLSVYQNSTWQTVSSSEISFSSTLSANQALPTTTWTKILFDQKLYDYGNFFNTSTSRYQPTVPGRYLFIVSTYFGTAVTRIGAGLYKNGVMLNASVNNSTSSSTTAVATYLVDINGTTDYIEAWGYQEAGTTINLQTAQHVTFFQGLMVSRSGGSGGSADNLGNHTASSNLVMGANWISGDGGNEGIRVDNSGNVGIGVASPSSKLHVHGVANDTPSTTNASLYLTSSGQGYGALFGNSVSSAFSYIQTTVNGSPSVPGVEAALSLNPTGGNVGIGTVAPTARLEVNGTVKATQFTGSASGLTGFAGLFQRITAIRTTSAGTSAVTTCPAGYTLIDWNIYAHAGPAYDSGSGWNYCTCAQSGNGITATLNVANSNGNFHCSCSGLCAKN